MTVNCFSNHSEKNTCSVISDKIDSITVFYPCYGPWGILREPGQLVDDILHMDSIKDLHISDSLICLYFQEAINNSSLKKIQFKELPSIELYTEEDSLDKESRSIIAENKQFYPINIDVDFVLFLYRKNKCDTLGIGRYKRYPVQYNSYCFEDSLMLNNVVSIIGQRDEWWANSLKQSGIAPQWIQEIL